MVLNRWVAWAWGRPWRWLLCASPALVLWVGALSGQLGANPAEALVRGLGDWALRFLCLTLTVTPLRVSIPLPALAPWRRTLGLSTWAYACQHALTYAWLDLGWDVNALWRDVVQRPLIAVGLLSWCVLCVLAASSPAGVKRWLGATRWRRLHRVVYGVVILAVLHLAWMHAAKNHFGEVAVYAAWGGACLCWRWVHQRRRRTTS